MFSLIITIISIALVALLALATIYYGGSALSNGSAAATAARFITEGQQINGAKAVAVANNETPATIQDLVDDNYLSQLPAGWTVASGYITRTVSDDICTEYNDKLDVTGPAVAGVVSGLAGCNTVDNLAYYQF